VKNGKGRIIPHEKLKKDERTVRVTSGSAESGEQPSKKEEDKGGDMDVEAIKDNHNSIQAIKVTCPCGQQVKINCVFDGEHDHESEDE